MTQRLMAQAAAEAAAELAAHLRFQQALGSKEVALSEEARQALERLERPLVPGAEKSLSALADQAAGCQRCPLSATRTRVVFGEGSAEAELLFIGEGPGQEEDLSGRPFVGRSGQLLTRIIKAMGFERSEVYITNVVKCRPPNNRDPKDEEIATCRPWLEAQLGLIKPKVIVALGAPAARSLLTTKQRISQLRGRFHDFGGTPLMPTFHPSYLLRNDDRQTKGLVWSDMKMVLDRLGRKPAGA